MMMSRTKSPPSDDSGRDLAGLALRLGRVVYAWLGQRLEESGLTPAQFEVAPCFGEHTEYVCRQILGMSEKEITELLVAGALQIA